jgi:hypothetical protein
MALQFEAIVRVAYGEDCFDRVRGPLRDHYGRLSVNLWQALLRGVPGSFDQPTLLVVHSPVCRSATIVGGGDRVLVYDQYLGQALNKLTRLYLSAADSPTVNATLAKLWAQREFVAGRNDQAALFGLWARALGLEYPLPSEPPDSMMTRGFSVAVQESFVIAHELAHTLLQVVPGLKEVLSAEVTLRLEALDKYPMVYVDHPHLDRTALVEQVAADERRSLSALQDRMGLNKPLRSMGSADEVENLLRLTESELFGERLDEELVAESVCDSLAWEAVSMMFRNEDQAKILDSVFLAVHHLRLLQLLDHRAGLGSSARSDSSVSNQYIQSVLRFRLLRTHTFWTLLKGVGDDQSRWPLLAALQHNAVDLNQKYSDLLMDQALVSRFSEFGPSLQQSDFGRQASPFAANRDSLKDLLGFPSQWPGHLTQSAPTASP